MGQKIKYQYSYFIHPFVIKENKYQKYLLKLLKNKNIRLRIFRKESDLRLYKYFLPKMQEFLFSSFGFSENKRKKLEELPNETRAAILAGYPCTIFEYDLPRDVHGKTDENCIFFKIRKLEIVCFNTGICFLLMKTNLDNIDEFFDVLNFNYRFRDIQKKDECIGTYQNIHLQMDTFSDISKLTDLIEDITGSKVESIKLDLDTERFLSYSYVCIDQQSWGMNSSFENVENNFIKFSNFLPADNSVDYEKDSNAVTFSKWKYAKLSVSKQGVTLFASDADMYNYTILPDEFEGVYLYTYLLNLYKKIYLKKINFEFTKTQDVTKGCRKFVDFTKRLWIQEVTDEEVGSWVNLEIAKKIDIDRLYVDVKNQYDVMYKNMRVERNSKIMLFLVGILILTLIFNMLNYFNMF